IQWNWKSGVLLIILPVVLSIYFFKISKNEHEVYMNRTKNERKSWYISLLITKDITFKEIKFYDLGEYLVKKYKDIRKVFVDENIILYKKRYLFSIVFSVVNYILMSVIVFFIIFSTFVGEILIGTAMSIINSLASVETSFKQLINTVIEMHEDNLYIEQFIRFLELETDKNKLNEKSLINIDEIKSIEMKNVSYRYPNSNQWVLKNINFKIITGEKVSLVGKNGSGKSTLIKILSCQYNDYEGQVLINGVDLRNINKKKFLRKMGIVYQDFNKYEFNLRENISLGDLEKKNNDSEIIHSLCMASGSNILEKIDSIEQQLGVWFEDGVQLSGGEWQKLAIARAFFRAGDIYILDEPSAALDAIAEYEMFKNFLALIDNKIGLFITHKINNSRFADKIIVLKDGEITEQGTFDELKKDKREFYNLLNAKERK
ncbi:MAG: ATP-binding cassette domain-containing protein, partial [Sarcina sp.]